MRGIPSKCPRCGKSKPWREEINVFRSGLPLGAFGRLRLGVPFGLFARPLRKAMGCYRVTYRCGRCGHREEYDLPD